MVIVLCSIASTCSESRDPIMSSQRGTISMPVMVGPMYYLRSSEEMPKEICRQSPKENM